MYYDENVLIKLRRDYSKDEVVLFALNKIKELQIERGKDKSYIEELAKENLDLRTKLRNNRQPKEEQVHLNSIEMQKIRIKEQNKELKKLRKLL